AWPPTSPVAPVMKMVLGLVVSMLESYPIEQGWGNGTPAREPFRRAPRRNANWDWFSTRCPV
ncbi:MAG: hypothetical protein ACLP53_22420, partial [Isosphaeraceae bacterium]